MFPNGRNDAMIMRKLAIKRKLACLAAATLIGAALIGAQAQARGGWHGGGWHSAAWHGAAWHGAAWHGRFFPHHRFAFFHRHRFVGPFVGLYASGYSSCWTWVPTSIGWRRVWACDYPYGYGYY
jgi:hypothetical protein